MDLIEASHRKWADLGANKTSSYSVSCIIAPPGKLRPWTNDSKNNSAPIRILVGIIYQSYFVGYRNFWRLDTSYYSYLLNADTLNKTLNVYNRWPDIYCYINERLYCLSWLADTAISHLIFYFFHVNYFVSPNLTIFYIISGHLYCYKLYYYRGP